jgi:hypothetical protein
MPPKKKLDSKVDALRRMREEKYEAQKKNRKDKGAQDKKPSDR